MRGKRARVVIVEVIKEVVEKMIARMTNKRGSEKIRLQRKSQRK